MERKVTTLDENIAFSRWTKGSRTGEVVGTTLDPIISQEIGPKETYYLKVIDARGQVSEDNVDVRVVDTTAPDLTCPADRIEECTSPAGVTIDYNATANDICGEVTISCNPPSASTFSLGDTVVACTATDETENSEACQSTFTVVDTTSPSISRVTATPDDLWPPNHKMVSVGITVDVLDICDTTPSCAITSVASNEPITGNGTGNRAPDWEITGDDTVNLRAERSGQGDGRIYTITVECTDATGNTTQADTVVTVTSNQS